MNKNLFFIFIVLININSYSNDLEPWNYRFGKKLFIGSCEDHLKQLEYQDFQREALMNACLDEERMHEKAISITLNIGDFSDYDFVKYVVERGEAQLFKENISQISEMFSSYDLYNLLRMGTKCDLAKNTRKYLIDNQSQVIQMLQAMQKFGHRATVVNSSFGGTAILNVVENLEHCKNVLDYFFFDLDYRTDYLYPSSSRETNITFLSSVVLGSYDPYLLKVFIRQLGIGELKCSKGFLSQFHKKETKDLLSSYGLNYLKCNKEGTW